MHFSVCLPAVLRGMEVNDALKSVSDTGFQHYEIWGWWNLDLKSYKKAQLYYGLENAALCTRFVSLTDPSCRTEYVAGLLETVEVCKTLGCKTIISQVGKELQGISRDIQHESIVEGLKLCVPILEENDLTLVIEPLNTKINHPGYYLWEAAEAFQIIEEVGSNFVKVLYDLYHQYVMDDLKIDEITKNIDKIGHFHMAGFPGRNEPFVNCEIDYISVLKAIKDCGYKKSVGLEYMTIQDPQMGLRDFVDWLKQSKIEFVI